MAVLVIWGQIYSLSLTMACFTLASQLPGGVSHGEASAGVGRFGAPP